MRAARLYATRDIRVADEIAPEPGAGETLVRVTAVGICGSDLHWWTEGSIGDARLARPLALGHEGAGVIADGPRRGERVAIDPAIPCESCRACRDGYRNLCYRIRFAGHGETDGMLRELMPWPARLLHPLPDDISDAAGALLEPLGVALHALDLGHVPFGGSVAVVGCGPIGLLLVQLLCAAGARVLAVEPMPHRREAASEFGAREVADATAVLPGYGADVAFEMAGGDAAVQAAMESVRPGGRVVLGGIPDGDTTTFSASLARRKGLTIAMVRRMNEVYPRAIELASRGAVRLDPLVSARFPIADAAGAFTAAQRRDGLKIIVTPLSSSATSSTAYITQPHQHHPSSFRTFWMGKSCQKGHQSGQNVSKVDGRAPPALTPGLKYAIRHPGTRHFLRRRATASHCAPETYMTMVGRQHARSGD